MHTHTCSTFPDLPTPAPLALPCPAQVLSLGFLMTSYLKWAGLTQAEVASYRGIGALTGLAATVVFPKMVSSIGGWVDGVGSWVAG